MGTFLLSACAEAAPERRTLSVFAASSLTEAFEALADHFETAVPGSEVALTFAGSQVLRIQIQQGAPADVFASANPLHVGALLQDGEVEDPRVFAHNELVVIVPRDNPAGIRSFDDLARANRIVIAGANVPLGAYTREALARAEAVFGAGFEAAVLERVVSQENNARLVRAKVALGEADAAVVYGTDARASEGVCPVPIPADVNVRAEYWLGIVNGGAADEALVGAWVELVASPAGQAILAEHGFVIE